MNIKNEFIHLNNDTVYFPLSGTCQQECPTYFYRFQKETQRWLGNSSALLEVLRFIFVSFYYNHGHELIINETTPLFPQISVKEHQIFIFNTDLRNRDREYINSVSIFIPMIVVHFYCTKFLTYFRSQLIKFTVLLHQVLHYFQSLSYLTFHLSRVSSTLNGLTYFRFSLPRISTYPGSNTRKRVHLRFSPSLSEGRIHTWAS